MPDAAKSSLNRLPAAPFFAAPASRWRSVAGIVRRLWRRQPTAASPEAVRASCSWATASTRTTGGPKVRAPTMKLSKRSSRSSRSKASSTSSRAVQQGAPPASAFIPAQTGNLLSGAPLTKGAVLHGGVSMDQVLANHIGQDTVQPSMVLGCEQPITGYHETNFSMAYSSHISWQSADSPVPMEVYPSLAFDSLFENRGSQRNLSMLDRVKEQRRSLSRQESAPTDKAKLDEYLTSVRDVEKRVEGMRGRKNSAEDDAPSEDRPAWSRWSGPTTACPRTSASTCG